MNKLYSTKSNARRGAVAALGSTRSMEGFDYRIVSQGGKWTWATIEKPAPAVDMANADNMAETTRAEDTETPGPENNHIDTDANTKPAIRPRTGTKQSMLIDMLRRPEGATIAQIVEATGWRCHTARGVISGAVKKKLGLNVTSEKIESGDRVYRITDAN